MPKNVKQKNELTKIQDVKMDKIRIFFRKPILKNIVKILTMEHGGFRTYKSVKNINRLFNNIDLDKYRANAELESYIWCIRFVSKKWLDGYVSPDIIMEIAKRDPQYDNIKGDIILKCMEDKNIISAPEAKAIFDLISEALQYGFIASLKDEYINLLDDINMENPGAFKELVARLFKISKSLLDIQYNTNLIADKITFNTSDIDSIREALSETITSLTTSNNLLKTGIKRLNTLLSPAYMNGRLYVYAGAPGSGKSLILLKTALDIRKYNPDYISRTPGMKPCVLYISMENTFTETIERIWNMTFDDSITDHTENEALDMLCNELGIARVMKDDIVVKDENNNTLEAQLIKEPKKGSNIELAIQYYPYRSISTDDLFTIIQDLRDENLEVCALVFDYMKRIRPAEAQADNVKLELNRIVNELKALAVIKNIPVISAHQLNRVAASIIDNAARQGRGDGLKQTGREHIGDAYEIVETADWLGMCMISYKPGTDQKYFEVNVVKRRRIDQSESEFAKYTYLAHPFSKNNNLRLVDDIYLDKVLSLQSLNSDIDLISKEKTNAVPRLKTLEQNDFDDFDDDYM